MDVRSTPSGGPPHLAVGPHCPSSRRAPCGSPTAGRRLHLRLGTQDDGRSAAQWSWIEAIVRRALGPPLDPGATTPHVRIADPTELRTRMAMAGALLVSPFDLGHARVAWTTVPTIALVVALAATVALKLFAAWRDWQQREQNERRWTSDY